ncbi:sugar phosphate nucleotidyltransferase [Agriterribacter sp.]|uniref:sugar phosphate nucleotidyltransferase n=1 Tax=Agriterribacter sp. TaxID=2821509 RepID=UPI002BBF1973|nr:sugar phosphate nucleotidyltransferase [Agriterribacter sp.]HRP57522.1 sugar phosphate nucleotidyltransferase [Agriterribacter sp.]
MKPTLVIMAAGMASRYGSLKQIQRFGPSGETIMDYSIYDAYRAGFGKVVFIIREQFSDDFRAIFESRLKGKIAVDYVYQNMQSFAEGYDIPADRTKPWGTAHAVLCASAAVHEPFIVINADDFYGRDAFEKAHQFLMKEANDHTFGLIGYELIKTLSDNGSVSRGVCRADASGNLIEIAERTKIYRDGSDIVYEEDGIKTKVPSDSKVSMNFWCFTPYVFSICKDMFSIFLQKNINQPKAEIYVVDVGAEFIKIPGNALKVIPTRSKWFGVTYKEDAPGVESNIKTLVANGEYPQSLWENV